MPRNKTHTTKPTWQPSTKKAKSKDTAIASGAQTQGGVNLPYGAGRENIMGAIATDRSSATPLQAKLQAKLTVGEVGDKYEQEADLVARQVVDRLYSTGGSSGDDDLVQKQTISNAPLQRLILQADGLGGGTVDSDFEQKLNRTKGGGQSLSAQTQSQMGGAMGADFSSVKIHTGSEAQQLASSVQAKAFTTGRDIFFNQGQYQPESRGGQELLAHELTHVIQQTGTGLQRKTNPAIANTISRVPTGKLQRLVSAEAVKTQLDLLEDDKDSTKLFETLSYYERNIEYITLASVVNDKKNTIDILNDSLNTVEGNTGGYKKDVLIITQLKTDIANERSTINKLNLTPLSILYSQFGLPTADDLDDEQEGKRQDKLKTIKLKDYFAKERTTQVIRAFDTRDEPEYDTEEITLEEDEVVSVNSLETLEEKVEEAETAPSEDVKSAKHKKNKYWEAFTNWVKRKFSAFADWISLTYGRGGLLGIAAFGSWAVLKGLIKLAWWALKNIGKSLMKPFVIMYNAIWNKDEFLKDTKQLYKERKDHAWNTTYEALTLFVEEVRDWAGWISVISALIGIIPVPGFQAALAISGIAGSINVIAGMIAGVLRGLHTVTLQTMKYLGSELDTKIWERSKEKSLAALIAIATTGLTNATTSIAGGSEKSLGSEFKGVTSLETNVGTIGTIDDGLLQVGTDSSTGSVAREALKQSTYATTDANFGEIGDKSAEVNAAIGVALLPIKLVAGIIAGIVKMFRWIKGKWSRKPQAGSLSEQNDPVQASSTMSGTMVNVHSDLQNTISDLTEMQSEMFEASNTAQTSQLQVRKDAKKFKKYKEREETKI